MKTPEREKLVRWLKLASVKLVQLGAVAAFLAVLLSANYENGFSAKADVPTILEALAAILLKDGAKAAWQKLRDFLEEIDGLTTKR